MVMLAFRWLLVGCQAATIVITWPNVVEHRRRTPNVLMDTERMEISRASIRK